MWVSHVWVQSNNHPAKKPYLKPTIDAIRESSTLQKELGYMCDAFLIDPNFHYRGHALRDRQEWAHTAWFLANEGENARDSATKLHETCAKLASIINSQENLYQYPTEAVVKSNFNRTPTPMLDKIHAVMTDRDIKSFFQGYYGNESNNMSLPDNFGATHEEIIGRYVNYERASTNLLFELNFSAEKIALIVGAREDDDNA